MPTVSVVIPTFNRLHRLRQVLVGIAEQDGVTCDMEVIVVSDGSTDGTDDHLRSGTTPLPIVFIPQANQGPAVARNTGVAAASGDLVLFLDDDVVPAPGLIRQHLASHGDNGEEVVVLGPMLNPPDHRMSPWVAWEQAMLYKQYDAMRALRWQPSARQFYTGNASLRRRHVVDAGGFDPSFRRAEDVELAYRLARRGLRFVFNDQAVGQHYAERSFRSWLDNAYAYGRNDVIFTRDCGVIWLLPVVRREFDHQHRLVRSLVARSLPHPAIGSIATTVLRPTASIASALGWTTATRSALSGIYSLEYYRGVADTLGGGESFLDLAPAQ